MTDLELLDELAAAGRIFAVTNSKEDMQARDLLYYEASRRVGIETAWAAMTGRELPDVPESTFVRCVRGLRREAQAAEDRGDVLAASAARQDIIDLFEERSGDR